MYVGKFLIPMVYDLAVMAIQIYIFFLFAEEREHRQTEKKKSR